VREFRNRRSRDLPGRITEYLNLGGLWNPELMDHDEVRTMLIDARDVIEIAERERGSVPETSVKYCDECGYGREHAPDCSVVSRTKGDAG
jgi:hypothetical protein